jgi:hypothetical protein
MMLKLYLYNRGWVAEFEKSHTCPCHASLSWAGMQRIYRKVVDRRSSLGYS